MWKVEDLHSFVVALDDAPTARLFVCIVPSVMGLVRFSYCALCCDRNDDVVGQVGEGSASADFEAVGCCFRRATVDLAIAVGSRCFDGAVRWVHQMSSIDT